MAKNYVKREKKPRKYFGVDFETTVLNKKQLEERGLDMQDETEVWSVAWCPVKERPEPEDVTVVNNIYQFFEWMESLEDGTVLGFANLKFDGSFILNELIREGFTPALKLDDIENETYAYDEEDKEIVPEYGSVYEMYRQPYSYECVISNMGAYYSITIRFDHTTITIVDVTKVLPMSLREMGKGFDTKYRKLNMEYSGDMHAFGEIDAETQLPYIINDVLVLSEAWYKARAMGLTENTIAACALKDFKAILTPQVFDVYFPDLTAIRLPCGDNAYEYIKRSYAGGICYRADDNEDYTYVCKKNLTPGMLEKLVSPNANIKYVKNVLVADVNSLYPFSLHSNKLDPSNPHYYPIGEPEYHKGEPTKSQIKKYCIFRRFKCHFDIKPKHVPFIHIRNTKFYRSQDLQKTDKVFGSHITPDGESTLREYTMTQVDFELFCESYNITDYEPIDYLIFEREEGIFDAYVDKWMALKIKGKKEKNAALVTESKLMLNSLYGKLATSTCNSTKIVLDTEIDYFMKTKKKEIHGTDFDMKDVYEFDGVLKFKSHESYTKKPVALAAGSYCTSIARSWTLRCANKLYDYVKYIDTDSLHLCDIDPEDVDLPIDDKELGYWDMEISQGAIAKYVKQKTYIEVEREHSFKSVLDENGNPSYNLIIKAAGLSENGKNIISKALEMDPDYDGVAYLYKTYKKEKDKNGNELPDEYEDYDVYTDNDDNIPDEDPDYEVLKKFIDDFGPGFGMEHINTKCKQIKGGVLIYDDDFSIN